MTVRSANARDANAAGGGRKPYVPTGLIPERGSKVAHMREPRDDLADACAAEPGRLDLMDQSARAQAGFESPARPPGPPMAGFPAGTFPGPRHIKRDHTGRDHG